MNRLNNWKIVHAKAPDDGRYVACIEGMVDSENPRFPSSSVIRTSYVTCYEMHGASMLVITARRSEYLLGTRHPSEYLTEEFLKSFLPEKIPSPTVDYDSARSQVVAFAENEYAHLKSATPAPASDAQSPAETAVEKQPGV